MRATDRKTGLTLVEVLVVIGMLGVVILLLGPLLSSSHRHPDLLAMSNGREIYRNIFDAVWGNPSMEIHDYFQEADPERFESSTEYFKWLMSVESANGDGVLAQDFRRFSEPGLSTAQNISEFAVEHNIWSVVTGLAADEEASNPFLITRNLNEQKLVDWGEEKERKLMNVGNGAYRKPFGEDGLIVINLGGGGTSIWRSELLWSNLNPNRLENQILEP